jgi:hypothetical protein
MAAILDDTERLLLHHEKVAQESEARCARMAADFEQVRGWTIG